MHAFYFKVLVRSALLLCMSILAAYICVQASYRNDVLLDSSQQRYKWQLVSRPAPDTAGKTVISAKADRSSIFMNFLLDPESTSPTAATTVIFVDAQGKRTLADLSDYTRISFEVRCDPSNSMMITIATFDEKISKGDDLLTYRSPHAFFDCDEHGKQIDLDLTRLTVPDWWFNMFQVNRANQGYALNKVSQVEFGLARNGPAGVPARVEFREVTLHGRHFGYLYLLAALLVLSWAGFALWLFRAHAAAVSEEVRSRLQKDMPFVAYQKLSLEPHRDKEKSALLAFLATHYADANLDLETVVTATGISRNKVNDILKAELGYTFTGYLNKLRMTEAARLLRESDSASVAEVAYSVGYNSTSYFNRLFKEEYQSTPRAFRDACRRGSDISGTGTENA